MASGEGDPAVPSAGEGSSRGGSHQRDKALHLEVQEARWCIARGSQSGAVDRAGDRGQVGFRGKCPSRWRVAVVDMGAGCPRNARTTPDSSSGFCTRIAAIEILCAGIHTGEGRCPIRIIEAWFRREAEEDWWSIQFKKSRMETRLWELPIGAIVAIHQV